MVYKIQITAQAESQQFAHVDYLMNTLQSDQAARHYVKEMQQLQKRIAQHPQQFPLSEDDFLAARGYRQALFPSMQYRVFFRIEEQTVYIVSIFHDRENYEAKIGNASKDGSQQKGSKK